MISGGRARLGAADLGRAIRFWVEVVGGKLVAMAEGARATVDLGSGFTLELVAGAPPTTAPFYLFARGDLAIVRDVLAHRGVAFEDARCDDGAPGARATDSEGNAFVLRAAPADGTETDALLA